MISKINTIILVLMLIIITDSFSQRDIFDYHLYEINNFKKVTKRNIKQLLPLKKIDLSAFKDVNNLDVLNLCNFCEVEELIVGSYISDFSLLKDRNSLGNLEYLDFSNSNFPYKNFEGIFLPEVKKLNISGIHVNLVRVNESFPKIREIVIRNSQYSKEEQEMLEKLGIRIVYDIHKPLPLDFNRFEIDKYKDLITLGDSKFKKGTFTITVAANGKVTNVSSLVDSNSNDKFYNTFSESLKNSLYFQVDSISVRTITLPVKVK